MYDIENYFEAHSVSEALALLASHPEARLIAGGSDVLLKIREGEAAGATLVSLHLLHELRAIIMEENGNLRIGSLATFRAIEKSPLIQACVPVLAEAVGMVGGPQIRNVGTIGGNVCNGVTSADSASTLMAFDAVMEYTGLLANGEIFVRRVPITEHYVGAGKTALRRDAECVEILSAIIIGGESYRATRGHYIKYAMRNALDIATIGCSVNISMDGEKIESLRVAFGVAGPVPCRAPSAEKRAHGKKPDDAAIDEIAEAVLADIKPRDSWRGSAELRRHLAVELTRRCIKAALAKKCGGIAGASPARGVGGNGVPTQGGCPPSQSLKFKKISCTINGAHYEASVDVRASLADMLRGDFGHTSVKQGCKVGECGACTVLVDGIAVNSCIYLAAWADGAAIVTAEGLQSADGKLSAVQQAFVDAGAIQCGFCTPGFLLTATEMAAEAAAGRVFSEADVRRELSGHLCRCTGYENIVKAVMKVVTS